MAMSQRNFRHHTNPRKAAPSAQINVGGHLAYSADGEARSCPCAEYWERAVLTDSIDTSHIGHDADTGELMRLADVNDRRA